MWSNCSSILVHFNLNTANMGGRGALGRTGKEDASCIWNAHRCAHLGHFSNLHLSFSFVSYPGILSLAIGFSLVLYSKDPRPEATFPSTLHLTWTISFCNLLALHRTSAISLICFALSLRAGRVRITFQLLSLSLHNLGQVWKEITLLSYWNKPSLWDIGRHQIWQSKARLVVEAGCNEKGSPGQACVGLESGARQDKSKVYFESKIQHRGQSTGSRGSADRGWEQKESLCSGYLVFLAWLHLSQFRNALCRGRVSC